jgi:hypothetical protein
MHRRRNLLRQIFIRSIRRRLSNASLSEEELPTVMLLDRHRKRLQLIQMIEFESETV